MRRADEVIIEILKERPRKPSELMKECVKRGASKSACYRQLRQLIKLGEVREPICELVEKVKEADPEDVAECLNVLKDSSCKDVRYKDVRVERAKELVRFCRLRAAHNPGLLSFFENSMILEPSVEVREYLVAALFRLLETERENKCVQKSVLERIIKNNLKNVTKLVSEDPNAGLRKNAIDFFKVAGDIRGLGPIFLMIKNCDKQVFREIRDDLAAALLWRCSYLVRNHKNEIRKRIDELLADPSLEIRNRAKELLKISKDYP